MSPAVSKILSGKDRMVTKNYRKLQDHYNFYQDFCNPSAGHEKGSVEAHNKHLKRSIRAKIKVQNLKFDNLEEFNEFLWSFCHERNKTKDIESENLIPIPDHDFEGYRLETAKCSKFSLICVGTSGHMYSVPSEFAGLKIEARVFRKELKLTMAVSLSVFIAESLGPRVWSRFMLKMSLVLFKRSLGQLMNGNTRMCSLKKGSGKTSIAT